MAKTLRSLFMLGLWLWSALAFGAPPADVKGWQGYGWGITGDEIARIGGADVKRQERWWAPQRQFLIDYTASLTLDGQEFEARFRMNPQTERLSEVSIIDVKRAKEMVAPEKERFDALEALLVQKYGPATLRTDDDQRRREMPSMTLVRTWSFPTTVIELRHEWFVIPGTGGRGLITINYKPAKNSDANKL
jgi:hypothetical protein